jgi:hypothetical protein
MVDLIQLANEELFLVDRCKRAKSNHIIGSSFQALILETIVVVGSKYDEYALALRRVLPDLFEGVYLASIFLTEKPVAFVQNDDTEAVTVVFSRFLCDSEQET